MRPGAMDKATLSALLIPHHLMRLSGSNSASAPVAVILDVDVDGILEISAELFRLFLQQRIPRNHWTRISQAKMGDMCQNIPSNACSTLIASFALVSKYGIPPLDWQNVMARFVEI